MDNSVHVGAPPEPASPPVPPPSRWTGPRITAVVIGSVMLLMSLGLLAGGGAALWADRVLRENGYLTVVDERISTSSYALTTDNIAIDTGGAGVARSLLGTLRLRITPDDPASRTFVGIGAMADVRAYLSGVEHEIVADFSDGVKLRRIEGSLVPRAPASESFWSASINGYGTQTLAWPIRSGDWTVVAMNADGSRAVAVKAIVGATFPALPWIATALLIGTAVFAVAGLFLVVIPVNRARKARA